MTSSQISKIHALGLKLATESFRAVIRLCPEIRTATDEQKSAVCAAMRAKSAQAVDELVDDGSACPHLADVVFASAVLTLAQAGIDELRKSAA